MMPSHLLLFHHLCYSQMCNIQYGCCTKELGSYLLFNVWFVFSHIALFYKDKYWASGHVYINMHYCFEKRGITCEETLTEWRCFIFCKCSNSKHFSYYKPHSPIHIVTIWWMSSGTLGVLCPRILWILLPQDNSTCTLKNWTTDLLIGGHPTWPSVLVPNSYKYKLTVGNPAQP